MCHERSVAQRLRHRAACRPPATALRHASPAASKPSDAVAIKITAYGADAHAKLRREIGDRDSLHHVALSLLSLPDHQGRDRSLPKEMLRINLRNLGEVVARVGTYLEACNDALHEERHAADYGSEVDYDIDASDF